MSLPLWLHDRLFPLAPTFGSFPSFGKPLDIILLGLLGLSLVANLFLSDRRIQIATLALLGILLLQDQMRWQPWVYVYLLISLPFIFIPKKGEEKDVYENIWALRSIQVLLIGVYFWSGVNKFNPGFTEVTYQLMLTKLFGFPEGSSLHQTKWLGYVIPFIEAAVAIGLFFVKTRKYAFWGVIFTHLVIISYLVSMLGDAGNPIVIPWNVAMMIFVFLAFFGQNNKIVFREAKPKSKKRKAKQKQAPVPTFSRVFLLLIVLTWFMPALRLVGAWDNYLSFNLYTDSIKYLYIGVRGDALESLPPELNKYYSANNVLEEGQTIDAFAWSFDELNVPIYPERRVYKAISRHFCEQSTNSAQNYMFIEYQLPFSLDNADVFRCGQY